MTLAELNKDYIYTSDTTKYGRKEHWVVMEPDAEGKYRGDCEDYVLTLIDKVEGFSELELWFCKIGDGGHCIGKASNGLFIDCNYKALVDRSIMEGNNFNSFRKYWKIEIIWKKVQARVQEWISGFRK